MHYVFFLGSHPELSASEAFRVLYREGFEPTVITATSDFLMVDVRRDIPVRLLARLGGTLRIGSVLASRESLFDAAFVASALSPLVAQKARIGISSLGLPAQHCKTLALTLKKHFRAEGLRVRFILPQRGTPLLNTAQIIFNQLHRDGNCDITLIHHHTTYFLVRTISVQDIQSYELRDTQRPVRRLRVGMLPPKLAQMMLNLAPYTPQHPTVYDPFCGSGTILQEGWLAGHAMIGSDADERMITATRRNLSWIRDRFPVDPTFTPTLFHHDARRQFPKHLAHRVDVIVSEPSLGKPLTAPLSPTAVESQISRLGELYLRFFSTALPILVPRGYIVFLLPAFRRARRGSNFWLFPPAFLDEISRIGYRRVQLVPQALVPWYRNERSALLYARPDALVGREFTLWQKL